MNTAQARLPVATAGTRPRIDMSGGAPAPWRCRLVAALAAALAVAGCTPTVAVRVDSDVPEPLIEKYPVSVAVRYSADLAGHTFVEASEERPNWTIATGPSQTAMFDQLSTAMFERVTRLDTDSGAAVSVDAVLEPVISDIQFATPDETRLEFFEAWIKYDIRLMQPSGELIGDWVITAYGRAPQALFKSKESGLTQAVELALRDAGAKFSLGFPSVPGVQQWLDSKRGAPP